jgi:hypothetical protein
MQKKNEKGGIVFLFVCLWHVPWFSVELVVVVVECTVPRWDGRPPYCFLRAPQPGDAIILRYDPSNPTDARPDPSRATVGRWLVVLALLVLLPTWAVMATTAMLRPQHQ